MARGFGPVEPPPIGGRRPREVALRGPAVKRPKAPRGGRGGKGGDDANGKDDSCAAAAVDGGWGGGLLTSRLVDVMGAVFVIVVAWAAGTTQNARKRTGRWKCGVCGEFCHCASLLGVAVVAATQSGWRWLTVEMWGDNVPSARRGGPLASQQRCASRARRSSWGWRTRAYYSTSCRVQRSPRMVRWCEQGFLISKEAR